LPLDSNSVVLVTGGAFGVTADSAIGLARAARCRLVLVGRSTWPVEESSETAGLEAPQLRAKLIAEGRRRGDRMVPAEIERAVNRILKNRQIRANIAACQAAGSQVEYHAMDVRDRDVFGALIDDVYARYGRLDGVIHGAGVIEDKRIRDKTPDSFENVWRTKVDSALTLAAKLRPETLQFLVFFSSVSGRFGNAGQVDYCAANEFLNKLADHLSCRWPAKVVAINWGPWDGGMVTDELRRMYATVGFELIPIDEGVEFLLAEIRRSQRPSAEIVVSASVEQMLGAAVGSGA
jgi:NAD(P)-dependent dehydrogenase (short-subunit alcohol dehydrogenase family)